MPITTPVRTEYTPVFQPPKPQPKELHIKMRADHKKHEVIFSCKQEENLHEYTSQAVKFRADFPGKLHFSDPNFFGTSEEPLFPNQDKVLVPTVNQGQTSYFVTADLSSSEEMYSGGANTPIIIRVP